MKRRTIAAMLPALGLGAWGLHAQPTESTPRPVTLLVGGAPGSVPDMLARPLAERLGAALGRPIVVENKPGAGGSLAMAALVRSAADGQTLALATMSQAVFNSYLFAKIPYDPIRDLEPVAPLVTGAMVLAAHPAWPGASLADFVARAKGQPGQLFVAIPQLGSPPHVVALLLSQTAGIDVQMVPHKSGQDALRAVVAGEIAFLLEAPTAVAPQVRAGRLKAIAVTGAGREPLLGDTPTLREGGVPLEAEAWIGLVAPMGTPVSTVDRLNREVVAAMQAPGMRELMAALSFRVLASTPREFGQLILREHAKWGPAIRQAGLKLE